MLEPNFDMDDEFTIKDERAFWRQALIKTLGVLGFIFAVIVLGIVLVIHNVKAAPAFKAQVPEGELALRLTDDACTNAKVLAHLQTMVKPEFQRQFRAAVLTWHDGKAYASCYIVMDGYVFSIDEDGAPLQPIPYRMFVEEGV